MKVELVGIGRTRVNESVECANDAAILRAVKKHLFSHDVSILFDDEGKVGTVYSGVRSVGMVLCPERGRERGTGEKS